MKKIAFIFLLCSTQVSGQSIDSLREGFKNPPMDAWPRTWWHWTRSNISKEGITKDLEWMKRAGIAGFQLADVNAGGGQSVTDPIIFGTPQWLDAVHHTAKEAERLGLEMAIFSSPGWSLTGGPWVKPEQAMKKLVWSEMTTEGSRTFAGKLPAPPSYEGAGPNLPNDNTAGFYRDVAVIAFRTPAGEENLKVPEVISNNGKEEGRIISDNDLTTTINVRPDKIAWIQLNYEHDFQQRPSRLRDAGVYLLVVCSQVRMEKALKQLHPFLANRVIAAAISGHIVFRQLLQNISGSNLPMHRRVPPTSSRRQPRPSTPPIPSVK